MVDLCDRLVCVIDLCVWSTCVCGRLVCVVDLCVWSTCLHVRRRPVRDHCREAGPAERVLEESRELRVAVGHVGGAPRPIGERVDAVPEREQRAVDVGALREPRASVPRL